MSKNVAVTSEVQQEEIEAALHEAQKQGLPPSWKLIIDDKHRKKWIAPAPDKKKFSSLDKAIEYANFKAISGTDRKRSSHHVSYDESSIGNTITSDAIQTHTETVNTSTPTKRKSVSNTGRRKKKIRSASSAKIKVAATATTTCSNSTNQASRKRKASSTSSSSLDIIHVNKISSSPAKETRHGTQDEKSNKCSTKDDLDYVSDPEISLDIPPNYDENSSVSKKYNRCIGTVHWDPHSIDGLKVGHRIRVYDFNPSTNETWKHGRIVRYDPISHKHKIVFFGQNIDDNEEDYDDEQWLMLKNENIQLGGEFVWALVKGFAWWPAQILHCHFGRKKPNTDVKDLTTQPVRDGYVLVEFFDSDEVAAIRDTADFLRPFRKGFVDEVIRKNKKKRNEKAVESGIQEEIATQEVRNDAAKFYAERAFQCANRKAHYYLGMKVEILREDINYPIGMKLVGTVRQFSLTTKKWLVAYDPPPVNKEKYSPKWHNLRSKQLTFTVIDPMKGSKRKQYEPNDEDIFPFLFGYVGVNEHVEKKCSACVLDCSDDDVTLQCSSCKRYCHPGCLDPPMPIKAAECIIKNGDNWVCNKCVRCKGCRQLEIVFGTSTVAQPMSLFLEGNHTLDLCCACIPMYDKKMFCPTCAHVWDDTRFQRIQKQAQNEKKYRDIVPYNQKDEDKNEENMDAQFQWKSPSTIDDSYFYPEETEVWGYNEDSMIFCDSCELWVHAGCAGLTKNEYLLTNEGKHPIYSNEFLCRTCCKRKCLSLLNMLKEEDIMGLFAEPVTDAVAHNYSDIIKNPMDLQTMVQHAHEDAYRNYAWLRESFELMVLNALTFNIGYTIYWNEAKRFYKACRTKVFDVEGKGAPPSKYREKIKERFLLADRAVQAEKDRVKTDETTEKKDLVAGSQVLAVKLGPLAKPSDPPSCVPCFEVRLDPIEALYCSWMDACFTCGSSGAADTLLFCVDCGEAYHSFCAMAPIHSMNEAAINGWRCPNCKLCEISGESTSDELKLIYCEMCDRGFSIDFLDPPLKKVPSGIWVCGQCVDCTKCHNAYDNGNVSRAYWSKNPSLCRGCGGCDEIIKPKRPIKKETTSNLTKKIKNVKIETKSKPAGEKEDEIKPKSNKKAEKKGGIKQKSKSKPKVEKKSEIKQKPEKSTNPKDNNKDEIKQNSEKSPKPVEKILKTKEELKEEALAKALKEAKARGLPDGWTCFYGAANRKRWRSPPPHERVFDSIPKALLYILKMKRRSEIKAIKAMKASSKKATKAMRKMKHNILPQLCLDKEQEWKNREIGYDDNTSLMSDGETLHRILDRKIGLYFCKLFDPSDQIIASSNELKCLPHWLYQRAARFTRFLKRLPKRNKKQRESKGIDHSSQMIVCKMASSFIFVICKIFEIEIKDYIRSHKLLESLLLPLDLPSGTIVSVTLPIDEDISKKKARNSTYVTENKERLSVNISHFPPTEGFVDPQRALTETALVVMASQKFVGNLTRKITTNSPSNQNLNPGQHFNTCQNAESSLNRDSNNQVKLRENDGNSENIPLFSKSAEVLYSMTTKEIETARRDVAHALSLENPLHLLSEAKLREQGDRSDMNTIKNVPHQIVEPRHENDLSREKADIPASVTSYGVSRNFHVQHSVESTEVNRTTSLYTSMDNDMKKSHIDIKEKMSAQEFDIANALLGLTSPARSRPSLSNTNEESKPSNKPREDITVDMATSIVDSTDCKVAGKEIIVSEEIKEPLKVKGESEHMQKVFIQNEEYSKVKITQGNKIKMPEAKKECMKKVYVAKSHQKYTEEKKMTQMAKSNEEATKPVQSYHDEEKGIEAENQKENVYDDQGSGIENETVEVKDVKTLAKSDAGAEKKEKAIKLPWLTSVHKKIEPLLGWPSSLSESTSVLWRDPRRCCLCNACSDDDAGIEPLNENSTVNDEVDLGKACGAGRLFPLPNGGWIHANCALWSSEVWETPHGGFLNGLLKARSRAAKLKCFGCGRAGATLGCHKGNCMKNYHYPCARACGVAFMENHKLYCSAHKASAKGPLRADFSEPMKSLKASEPKDMVPDTSLSIRCGSLVVHSLGKIQTDIDGFHSEHYIMPPGFESTRIFWSYKQAKTRTLYFMKIKRSSNNTPLFTLTTSDSPNKVFKGDDVNEVYSEVMQLVLEINATYFSNSDMFSIYPMKRKMAKGVKAFCLNGPQFFGFGVDNVREELERQSGAVACAVPLTEKSITYNFCFKNPTEEAVTDLQRKRAAVNAEKALENLSGCARTEGMSAVDKSTSSGRITRALVRKAEEDDSQVPSSSGTACRVDLNTSVKFTFESNQAKYKEMKKYPMEQRLAAKRSHIHGWGLFAKIFFPKHSMIAEYMGETIGQSIADKREKEYEVLGMGSCYMFRLDLHNIVDATQIGCMARFMNHCCAANAYAKVVTVNTNLGLEKKIVVFANQDIQVGQEITYDYKFPVEDGSLRCTCGAPNCIGRMN